MLNARLDDKIQHLYLPDIKTASYCPRLAAIIRCFNLLRDGRTSNAGDSAENHIYECFNNECFFTQKQE